MTRQESRELVELMRTQFPKFSKIALCMVRNPEYGVDFSAKAKKALKAAKEGKMENVHFSSKTVEWETPQKLFDKLNSEYGFTLDPASTDDNAKCEKHYTIKENGLSMSWEGETVFCNPPYGKTIGLWVQKAYEESKKPNTLVVMLLPARTDTRWFHDFCKNGEVEFLKGRLKFGCAKNSAPFPSMIVRFGGKHGTDTG